MNNETTTALSGRGCIVVTPGTPLHTKELMSGWNQNMSLIICLEAFMMGFVPKLILLTKWHTIKT